MKCQFSIRRGGIVYCSGDKSVGCINQSHRSYVKNLFGVPKDYFICHETYYEKAEENGI